MKILVIKLSPVEGLNSSMIRTLALTKGLLLLGHEIDFITIPIGNNHVKTSGYDFLDEINLVRTSKNEMYEAVISKQRNKGNLKSLLIKLLKKTYHMFSLYDYTHAIAKKIDSSNLSDNYYDIVISSSDPKTSHIAVKQLLKRGVRYNKWIQYWGDPMAIDITKKSIYPKWIVREVERKLLSSADKIVYVSPFTLDEQKRMFPRLAEKMSFLPVPYINEKWFKKTSNEKFTVGYFGAYFSRVRDIMPLYEAGEVMKDSINLNILGDSDIYLQETDNIKIYPRGDISKFEEEADLLICMLNKSGTQIPGKVYHYAATNKPILVLLDGEKREDIKVYLESFNRYIICNNDVRSIVTSIRSIMKENRDFTPCKEFNPEVIAKEFIS